MHLVVANQHTDPPQRRVVDAPIVPWAPEEPLGSGQVDFAVGTDKTCWADQGGRVVDNTLVIGCLGQSEDHVELPFFGPRRDTPHAGAVRNRFGRLVCSADDWLYLEASDTRRIALEAYFREDDEVCARICCFINIWEMKLHARIDIVGGRESTSCNCGVHVLLPFG
jgi:hypothetical protein